MKKIYFLMIVFLLAFSSLVRAEKSSLNIQNMDIHTLIKSLAIKHNVNIVSTPEVKGKVSLNLKDVTLEDILTAIANSMGYRWRREGPLYIISQGQPSYGNDFTEIRSFPINYADLNELIGVVKWSFEKAKLKAYPQERILLIEADKGEFAKIQKVIASLDIPPKQALIEAKVLEINLDDGTTYGIDWGNTYYKAGENDVGSVVSLGPQSTLDTKPSDPSQFSFGYADSSFHVKLNALEKNNAIKTLATPRLMVLDGKSAEIIIGGKLGYYITTTTETSTLQSVEYLDTGTQLKITPKITGNGHILMQIHPEVSTGSISGGLPQKDTTAVTTSIMVKAGETIFIGGLIRTGEIKSINRIPILGHIPLLGPLFFSNATTQIQKKELVILLTPHIVPVDSARSDFFQDESHPDEIGGMEIEDEVKKWRPRPGPPTESLQN
ncbi:MAG: hypothetical protein ACMUJM_16495 [bacterium]